jgi:hypothetical protein
MNNVYNRLHTSNNITMPYNTKEEIAQVYFHHLRDLFRQIKKKAFLMGVRSTLKVLQNNVDDLNTFN